MGHDMRNWRNRLESAANQWLETDEAKELARPSTDPVERRARLKAALVVGFNLCRAWTARKPKKGGTEGEI